MATLRCLFQRFFALAAALCLLAGASPGEAGGVRGLDAAGLQRLLKEEPKQVLLLDVRTPGEFAGGRIPGSTPIPMDEVPGRLAEIPKEKKVVAICASGARSAAVAKFLSDRGYPWVANLSGGVFDWTRRGLPLER
jgi:rhodanese-related sulfurtransferase